MKFLKMLFEYSLIANHQIYHCVKSAQIRSYFWSVFSCIRTEYGYVNLRILSEYRKIWTRNNSVFGQFSRSVFLIKWYTGSYISVKIFKIF